MHTRVLLYLCSWILLTGFQSCSRTLPQICETDLVHFQTELRTMQPVGTDSEKWMKWTEARMDEVQLLLAYLEDLQLSSARLAPVHDVGNSLVLAWGYASQGKPDSMRRALERALERSEDFRETLCIENPS